MIKIKIIKKNLKMNDLIPIDSTIIIFNKLILNKFLNLILL